MIEDRDTRSRYTRRAVLETATATAALYAGLPQVALAADTPEPPPVPVTVDLLVNGQRRALKLDPNFILAHLKLGQIFSQQNDHERAAAAFRSALAIDKGV